MSRNLGRDVTGRYHPSKALRLKIHRRCGDCGRDLFASEVKTIQGALMHRHRGKLVRGGSFWCGEVQWQLNPEFRKQRN